MKKGSEKSDSILAADQGFNKYIKHTMSYNRCHQQKTSVSYNSLEANGRGYHGCLTSQNTSFFHTFTYAGKYLLGLSAFIWDDYSLSNTQWEWVWHPPGPSWSQLRHQEAGKPTPVPIFPVTALVSPNCRHCPFKNPNQIHHNDVHISLEFSKSKLVKPAKSSI